MQSVDFSRPFLETIFSFFEYKNLICLCKLNYQCKVDVIGCFGTQFSTDVLETWIWSQDFSTFYDFRYLQYLTIEIRMPPKCVDASFATRDKFGWTPFCLKFFEILSTPKR